MLFTCLQCSSTVQRKRVPRVQRYCSNTCHGDAKYDAFVARWLAGEEEGRRGAEMVSRHVRRWILERDDFSCVECGWNERHPVDGLPLVQVDHRDGNNQNNRPENLRCLCPNCHSKTPTWVGRNKGWRLRSESN